MATLTERHVLGLGRAMDESFAASQLDHAHSGPAAGPSSHPSGSRKWSRWHAGGSNRPAAQAPSNSVVASSLDQLGGVPSRPIQDWDCSDAGSELMWGGMMPPSSPNGFPYSNQQQAAHMALRESGGSPLMMGNHMHSASAGNLTARTLGGSAPNIPAVPPPPPPPPPQQHQAPASHTTSSHPAARDAGASGALVPVQNAAADGSASGALPPIPHPHASHLRNSLDRPGAARFRNDLMLARTSLHPMDR
jgi:hypothetical protein